MFEYFQREEDNAIGRKEVLEFGLSMAMTVKSPVVGNCSVASKLFKILRREINAFVSRCFNKSGEMVSGPEAIDFGEEIARFN